MLCRTSNTLYCYATSYSSPSFLASHLKLQVILLRYITSCYETTVYRIQQYRVILLHLKHITSLYHVIYIYMCVSICDISLYYNIYYIIWQYASCIMSHYTCYVVLHQFMFCFFSWFYIVGQPENFFLFVLCAARLPLKGWAMPPCGAVAHSRLLLCAYITLISPSSFR